MQSTASRLRNDLAGIADRLRSLIGELPVKRGIRSSDVFIYLGPDYHWDKPTPEQVNQQLAIKRDYDEWFEIFRSVFRNPTNDVRRRISGAHQDMLKWVELGSNQSITPSPTDNINALRRDADKFHEILAILESGGPGIEILIPDTNALATQPNPEQYRAIVDGGKFVFMLLPTVLGELDSLKNNHRNPEFREKVNKAITRIKGWRYQGNLRDGVIVHQNITIRAVAREPDVKMALSWLDFDNKDDRIIASVLELQASHPAARLVLVTGDINLANKADAARIETAELP